MALKHKTPSHLFLVLAGMAAATAPCAVAHAQQTPMPGTSFSLLLGLGGGGLASISHRDIETDKYGFEAHGRAMASLALSEIVLDLGAGWYLSNIYGEANTKSRLNGDKDEIKTRAGFGEFTASYRFAKNWIFGPSARFTYGTETSFSPTDFSSKTPRVHFGARLGHQPLNKTGTVRVGLFAYTSLNIDHRQVTYGGLSFDFVLPLVKGDIVTQEKIVEKEKTIEVEKVVEKEVYVEKPVEKIVTQDNFIHTLDGSMVNFETDKDVLLPHSREFILKLGRGLVENNDAWAQLEVQGHTDERGEDDYNLDLSERRALTVRAALMESGVSSEKLRSKGYGETQPLASEQDELAWARNRRVELVFSGVTDGPRLAGVIEKIRRQSYMPQNCGPGGCK